MAGTAGRNTREDRMAARWDEMAARTGLAGTGAELRRMHPSFGALIGERCAYVPSVLVVAGAEDIGSFWA